MPDPLVHHLQTDAGLTPTQAEGVLGMILAQLRKLLDSDDYLKVQNAIQDAENLIQRAPDLRGGGLLGGLAGSLGGGRAKALVELGQGMKTLRIPSTQQRRLVDALKQGVEAHHPDLLPLIEKLTT